MCPQSTSNERIALRVNLHRTGKVAEVGSCLMSISAAYDHLFAWHMIAEQGWRSTRRWIEPGPWPVHAWGLGRMGLQEPPEALMFPEDSLYLERIRLSSPGWAEVVGKLNPLETLRRYLCDRHERTKDRDYRNKLESERLHWENEQLKTKVVRDQIAALKELGMPEPLIRKLFVAHVRRPLEQLDLQQDRGLLGDMSDARDSSEEKERGKGA